MDCNYLLGTVEGDVEGGTTMLDFPAAIVVETVSRKIIRILRKSGKDRSITGSKLLAVEEEKKREERYMAKWH